MLLQPLRAQPAGIPLVYRTAVPVRSIPDFAAALGRAATLAPYGTVMVSGSVYTAGDALAELGVAVGVGTDTTRCR